MGATVHGNVIYGMSAEAGLYVASVDYDISIEEKWVSDEESCDVAGSLFNPMATWSMQGVKKVGETLNSSVLGSAIVLANTVDFSSLDLSGGFKPFVTSTSS